ncbi:MAG TPA: fibrillarin-like rRNA/tRNA 2'-O-methyltransferase [Thermoplasmata archaeon]|nr:fibrillarin-like rRNA/tRNA 2'-O-methyltransferase [Thermoplasmata archaeon]
MTRRAPTPAPTTVLDRLWRVTEGERTHLFTQSLAVPPSLYGERVLHRGERAFRHFDPFRSKLAAALIRSPRLTPPRPGERWLYLGAAGGTTASHVADLTAPTGEVFAIERSPRPGLRLLEIANRLPGLFPILADARRPEEYRELVPLVDGLYADVSQPDQAAIVKENARLHLRDGGRFLFVLKLSSLSRDASPEENLGRVERELQPLLHVQERINLLPFHRAHVLLVGTSSGRATAAARTNRPPVRSPTRARRPAARVIRRR